MFHSLFSNKYPHSTLSWSLFCGYCLWLKMVFSFFWGMIHNLTSPSPLHLAEEMYCDYNNGEMTSRPGYQGSIPVLIPCNLILSSYTAVAGLEDIEDTTPSSSFSARACYNWKALEEATEGEGIVWEQDRYLIWSHGLRDSLRLSKSHNSISDSIEETVLPFSEGKDSNILLQAKNDKDYLITAWNLCSFDPYDGPGWRNVSPKGCFGPLLYPKETLMLTSCERCREMEELSVLA